MSEQVTPPAVAQPQPVKRPPPQRAPLSGVQESPPPPAAERPTQASPADLAAPAAPMAPVDRIPLGQPERRLAAPEREGYKRRWINDNEQGRIVRAQRGGWTFVLDEAGRPISRVVDKNLNAYLMEIPIAWWKDDQDAKQRKQDEVEQAWRHGGQVKPGEAVDGRYIPKDVNRVQDGRRRA